MWNLFKNFAEVEMASIVKASGRERWYRVHTLLDYYGRPILIDVLYSKLKAPKSGKQMFMVLKQFQSKLTDPKDRKILYPENEMTDVGNFDIPLLVKVINAILESRDYSQTSKDVKNQIARFKFLANKLTHYRNLLYHKPSKDLSESRFDEIWGELCDLLKTRVNMVEMNELKTCDIFSNSKYQDTVIFVCYQGTVDLFVFL